MKQVSILLSVALIIGTAQLNAMKRDSNQLTTPTHEVEPEFWLSEDIITKIAATCDSQSRAHLSLLNKCFNKSASIKTNRVIVDQPEFTIEEDNRLYYLFYGCIHNLIHLVNKALQKFDTEEYLSKRTLRYTQYFIKNFTNNDVTKLLPSYTDITINKKTTALHWAIDEEYTMSLIKLLLQQPAIDINAQNNTKDTPLHIAIRNHNATTVKLLLTYSDIDLTISNDDKHTALDLARFDQQQLASKYSNFAIQEQIGPSWMRKITEHTKKIIRNTTIIKLLMHAYGWDD